MRTLLYNQYFLSILIFLIISGLFTLSVKTVSADNFTCSEVELQPSDKSSQDQFGWSVAIDGDTAVVGAPYEDTGGSNSGAVYIFAHSGNSWTEQDKLQGSDTDRRDYFGRSVAIDGDRVVVGASGKNSKIGATYVFVQDDDGDWTEEQKLLAEDGQSGDFFGQSVDIDGDTVIVGADGEDSGGGNAGAAYIFTRTDDSWSQQQKLVAEDREAYDKFGTAVAIDSDTAVVGAYYEGFSDMKESAGAAYIFTRTDDSWSQQQKLVAEDREAYDSFGNAVAIDGNLVIVGAYYEGHSAEYEAAGAAYMFENNGGLWSQQQKLVAEDRYEDDKFGYSVSLDNNTVIVGAYHEGDSDQNEEAGAAYIFKKADDLWSQQQKLVAEDREANDSFGNAVAVYEDVFIVGAYTKSYSQMNQAGAIYIFSDCSPDSVSYPAPTVTLEQRVGNDGLWSENNVTISPGDQVQLRWSSTDTGFCVASGPGFNVSGNGNNMPGTSGTDTDIDEPGAGASSVYTITCVGGSNGTLADSITVTTIDSVVPAVTLEQKIHTEDESAWSEDHATIEEGDHIHFRWNSMNTDSCVGSAFYTGGETSGVNYNNAEPSAGSSRTYTVNCFGEGGVVSDSIIVTKPVPAPTVTLKRKYKGSWGEDDVTIKAGDRIDLKWSSTNADSCSGSGPGFSASATSGYDWFIDEPTIGNSSTYTVTCTGEGGSGQDSITITTEVTVLETKLEAGDKGEADSFGFSVDIDGNIAVVGAYNNNSNGAAYVFTQSDGGDWTEEQKLTAEDGQSGDFFGQSVAIDGDTVIVGAGSEDSGGNNAGAAYVFTRSEGLWQQQAKLQAGDRNDYDGFGTSVAIDGDAVIVGTPFQDTSAGAAYVFTRSEGLWQQQAKLQDNGREAYDRFGTSVAIDGNVAIVGAPYENTSHANAGSVYVFTSENGSWGQRAKLQSDDIEEDDGFGVSVAISNDTIIVGTKIGDTDSGVAYVFTYDNGSWQQQIKLEADDGEEYDHFGNSVDIDGDMIIVGAYRESGSGAAYVFTHNNDSWIQLQKLGGSDMEAGIGFGISVAISDNRTITGDYQENTAYIMELQ